MSVYRPKESPVYVYDFWWGGRRFSGSTSTTKKREAKEVEDRVRADAKSSLAKTKLAAEQPMTLEQACHRYWEEAGRHIKRPDQLEWAMSYIMEHIGADKPIRDICDDDVAALVAKRRGEFVDNVVAKRESKRPRKVPVVKKPPHRVSAATVNRTTTEPLKRILLRARDTWGREIGRISWRRHRLDEPKERVRSMSADEEARLFAALPEAFHPIIRFAIRTGCRASECTNLRWSDIDWGNRRITILGKGGKVATIPMESRVREILFPLQDVSAEFVFRLPTASQITYPYLYSAFLRATKVAGITNLRIHDLRHTAATRLVQRTGNIKMAMKLLRHEDISTTAKYAAVLDEDLREALETLEDQEVPAIVPNNNAKSLKEKQ